MAIKKCLILCVGVLVSTIFIQTSSASIQLKVGKAYFSGNTGEFGATIVSPGPLANYDLGGYVDGVTGSYTDGVLGAFNTFCMEKDQFVNPDNSTVYDYELTDNVNGDKLSQGTAWLYELFAAAELDGYEYDDSQERKGHASALQKVFWMLEDEVNLGHYSGALIDYYLGLLDAEFGSFANAQADYTGSGVGVLHSDENQDLIVIIGEDDPQPVPEPLTLAVWGITGALGCGFFLRKGRK